MAGALDGAVRTTVFYDLPVAIEYALDAPRIHPGQKDYYRAHGVRARPNISR